MSFWEQDCPDRGPVLSHAHWDKCTPAGGHPGAPARLVHFQDQCCHCGARSSEYRPGKPPGPPEPVVRKVSPEPEPQPFGWLADALRVEKKGHASIRPGSGIWVVPHGLGGGLLFHSHVVHEDEPVEVKNAYAAHIEQSHQTELQSEKGHQ